MHANEKEVGTDRETILPEGQRTETRALPQATPRLLRALRTGLRLFWDRLGLILALNMTWALGVSLVLAVAHWLPGTWPWPLRLLLLGVVGVSAVAWPASGIYYCVHLACARQEVGYDALWKGMARFRGPALQLGTIQCFMVTLFAANFWFYTRLGQGIGLIATLVCLYAFLFWLQMSALHFPLLIAQETGVFDEPGRMAKRGALAVVRRAFFLALGNPFYTLGLLGCIAGVTLVLFLTAVPFVLLWVGLVAALTTQAVRALLVSYGILPQEAQEEPVPDEKF